MRHCLLQFLLRNFLAARKIVELLVFVNGSLVVDELSCRKSKLNLLVTLFVYFHDLKIWFDYYIIDVGTITYTVRLYIYI